MLIGDLKIWVKYPLVIVTLALLAAFATGFVAYTHSAREMQTAAEFKMLALLESRKAALNSYFDGISEDLRFQTVNPLVIDALGEFRRAWNQLGEPQTDRLQRLYITDNPYPTGQKENLDTALDGSDYSITHMKYHPVFRKFLQERGYYDIFLFDPDGNLVYTVFKELDYATNLVNGPWKDTGLGQAFRAARDTTKPGSMAFFDFQPYAPSNGAPASFISTPVYDKAGTLIGVLAFQMPIGRLNEVMQVTTGMGETGETYVVGRDLLMRSDSRFSKESTILKTRVDTVTSNKALNGETGVEVTLDYRGVPVLSAYAQQDFLGVRWAIMAEVDESEVLAPVHEMRKFMLLAGAVITVMITAVGFFISLNLSRPIVAMTAAMVRLARGDLEVEIPSLNKSDEIGKMAKALKVFQKNAAKRKRTELKNRRLRQGLAATGTGTWVADIVAGTAEWDDCSLAIFGLTRKQFSGDLKVWENALHPDDRKKTLKHLDKLNAEKATAYDIEYRIVRPSGEVRNVQAEGTFERDQSGNLLYHFGTHRDITERKEKELENERLRIGLRTSGVGTYFYDTAADTLDWDDNSLAIFGLSRDQLTGLDTWSNALHPDDRDATLKFLDEQTAKGSTEWNREFRIVRPSGEVRFVHAEGFFERDEKGREIYHYGTHRDITERKETEEELRRREEFLQTLLDTSPVPIYITSKKDGRFLMANQAAAELNRLTQEELLQRSSKERYYDSNDRKELTKQLEKTGRIDAVDLRARRIGTGEECWLSFNARAIDYKGEEAVLSVTQDITERKQAERVLEQTNERLEFAEARQRAILESMVDAVITIGQTGNIQSFSHSAEKMFGFAADEVIGQKVKMLIPGDIAAEHDGYLQRYADTGDSHIIGVGREVQALRRDGSVFPVDLAVAELRFQGEQLYVGVMGDITERKQAEESLKHQNALVDLLRQTASDANEATSFEQGAGVCLNSISAYTGWPVGHVYLLSEEDDDLLVPSHIWYLENKKRFKAIFDVTEKTSFRRGVGLPGRVLENGEPAWIKDVTLDPNFPRAKMVDDLGVRGAFAFPVWAASRVVAVFEFFDEEASEPDESLLQTVTHIGSQLGRLYEREKAATSLREARDAAEEATRAKDMFLAAMSHEIRTPMNGVVGMIELLQGTALADDQRRMLETAKDSSFALLTVINDILDFSKIEAGKMEIENVAFDLRKAADTVGEMLGGVMAAEKGLPLVVHVQPEVPPLLLGDQVRIRQILLNLTGNAVKFTERGEVHIGISVARTHKDGSVDVVYEIKDSGIGMTGEQVERLFKPFEQAEASTTRRYGGTGLGLSIVTRLSELMGGKIEVESALGKGSTFRVTMRHGVAKAEAGEPAGVELGRIKMLALAVAGSRTDLLAQLLEENDHGQIDLMPPSTGKAALLGKLAAAGEDGDPYALVYLPVEVGTSQQDQLRRAIEANKELKAIPRFVVERHNTPVTQDIPGSVLIPVTPFTETILVRALAIVLGKASPDIVSRVGGEGRAAEVPSIKEAEAAGTLILVAEDNKTNQDVIGRQLAVFGYAHEIADDGEIALDMLSKRAYGLLLSDVHMPNMDGYRLTEAIRANEKKPGTRLPIVAVTANALQGEGDRCLDAGMDAYMAKPVRMKELRNCLRKWLPKTKEGQATDSTGVDEAAAAASPGDKSDSSVVDLGMLIEMFGDDEEMITSILADFPPAAWEGIDEIESACKAKNWAAVGDTGHRLKSAARTIGANQLADIFEGLEEAGEAGDIKTIKKLLAKLRPAMAAVDAYVRERV